jgi:hypothetical protein
LLELSPGSLPSSSAFTRSDRGGARFGAGGAGLEAGDEELSGVCEFAGEELEGVESAGGVAGVLEGLEVCPQTPTLPASKKIKSQLRIRLFYPPC